MNNNNNRRPGDELQRAIYEVTYRIFASEGYEAVTFSRIAKEAKTSRSVIYRYWDTPFDLVFETVHAKLNSWDLNIKIDSFVDHSFRQNLINIAKGFSKSFDSVLSEFNLMMLFESHTHPEKIKTLY